MCTSSQKLRIVNLLTKTNSHPDKVNLVATYTKGRATEIGAMYSEEAEQLGAALEVKDKSMNGMRRKIIAMAHQLGWKDVSDKTGQKVDYFRIDKWMKTYTLCKLPMAQLRSDQLKLAVDQFETMFKKEMSHVG